MFLSGLEMSAVGLKRRKTRLADYFFLLEDKNKTQLSLSPRAREVAGDVS